MSHRAAFALLALVAAGGGVWLVRSSATPQSPRVQFDEVAREVTRLRGLSLHAPLAPTLAESSTIVARVRQRITQEYSQEHIRNEGLLLQYLGLLPASANYLQLSLDLVGHEVVGLYDAWAKEFLLAQNIASSETSADVVAHEITHALQDAAFDLRAFQAAAENSDARLARQALVEGDAQATMLERRVPGGGTPWTTPHALSQLLRNTDKQAPPAGIPNYLFRSLVFPYREGLVFVAGTRALQPWSAVDAMYKKPPLSTEQILHPGLYARYERPHHVSLRILASDGCTSLHEDVAGEFVLVEWLAAHAVSRERAEIAGQGWGGDRIALLAVNHAASGVLVISTWDSATDALEFQEAAVDALSQMAKQRLVGSADHEWVANVAGTTHWIAAQGNRVAIYVGSDVVAVRTLAEIVQRVVIRR